MNAAVKIDGVMVVAALAVAAGVYIYINRPTKLLAFLDLATSLTTPEDAQRELGVYRPHFLSDEYKRSIGIIP